MQKDDQQTSAHPDSSLYKVAGLTFRVTFEKGRNDRSMIYSFEPFVIDESDTTDEPLFSVNVNDRFRPEIKGMLMRAEECGGCMHEVYRTEDGKYQFHIYNIENKPCCLVEATADFSHINMALAGTRTMRIYGLTDALMLVFAFASHKHGCLLMHSSVVRKEGIAYMFLGVSGTGKSTHTANWQKYLDGCDLINDDNPVIRIKDGQAQVYGSPWSGKTPCYRSTHAPIGALVLLKQAPINMIRKMEIPEAFATIHASCSLMRWDENLYKNICKNISDLLERVPVFFFENLPNEAAVLMSHSTIKRDIPTD